MTEGMPKYEYKMPDSSGYSTAPDTQAWDRLSDEALAILEAELKNATCPFCDSLALELARYGQPSQWYNRVKCRSCGCEGPSNQHPEQALAAWNIRPTEARVFEKVAELEVQLADAEKRFEAMAQAIVDGSATLRPITLTGDAAETYYLRAQLDAAQEANAVMRQTREHLDSVIIDQAARLGDMRPWADFGRRAVRGKWWIYNGGSVTGNPSCLICHAEIIDDAHPRSPDCPIPALLAQLEADND